MPSGVPNGITKVKTSISIDKELYSALNDYSQASLIPRSRIINKAIEELLQREYPAYKQGSKNWIIAHKKAPLPSKSSWCQLSINVEVERHV